MSYRYIGNKTRLTDVLTALVEERVPPKARVADLMCGTGSVAAALADAGFCVTAGDIMTFAFFHARVRLTIVSEPPFEPLGKPYPDVLAELNTLPPRQGFFFREYSPAGHPRSGHAPRRYFSPENASRLDAINAKVGRWVRDGLITEDEHHLLRHDLVLAANRVANIAGTYGHFWSKWTNGALDGLELRPTAFSQRAMNGHVVLRGAAEETAHGLEVELCYLDPPYTKRQYAANYHIPETIARGDEPEAIGASGLRPWRDQYSNFCSKVRIRESFTRVITGMRCPRFLISYSEDGLLSRTDMLDFLANFGSVACHELEVPRFRSNQSPLGRYVTEYVFDLRRS